MIVMERYIKFVFSFTIITLLVLCSFCVAYYSSMTIFKVLNLPELNKSSHVVSLFSGGFSIVFPLCFFLFSSTTIRIMMIIFFEIKISMADIFFSVSCGFIPLLMYQYFFWYNIISYTPKTSNISVSNYFDEIELLFNLTYKELLFIGDVSSILFFPISIIAIYYFCRYKNLFKIILSVCIPPLIAILFYKVVL